MAAPMSLPMTAGTMNPWSPGVPILQTAKPTAAVGGELSSLLTEVARDRAEAAELRLRLMHQSTSPPVQASTVKVQDAPQQRLISWQPPVQATAPANAAAVTEAAMDVRARLARLQQEIAREDEQEASQQCAAGTADKRPRPLESAFPSNAVRQATACTHAPAPVAANIASIFAAELHFNAQRCRLADVHICARVQAEASRAAVSLQPAAERLHRSKATCRPHLQARTW
ncbi:unnamed protein product [Symbiodinium natans]|uniref:Uncharacterized protein n=1 Tax=Symbiodinium natans TaxID=878477 RepID=A0A812NVY1_9DINO|nr:unnamed protein product [Symbiodinium natans]